MIKILKNIRDLFPWYLRPTYTMEIVPELVKEKMSDLPSGSDSKNKNNSRNLTKEKIDVYKINVEEVVYGLGVIFFLMIIRSYIGL